MMRPMNPWKRAISAAVGASRWRAGTSCAGVAEIGFEPTSAFEVIHDPA